VVWVWSRLLGFEFGWRMMRGAWSALCKHTTARPSLDHLQSTAMHTPCVAHTHTHSRHHQAAAPHMSTGGSIVLISSVTAYKCACIRVRVCCWLGLLCSYHQHSAEQQQQQQQQPHPILSNPQPQPNPTPPQPPNNRTAPPSLSGSTPYQRRRCWVWSRAWRLSWGLRGCA